MGISARLDEPFYLGGSATSSDVPGLYSIALGGHSYLVDLSHDIDGLRGQFFHRTTIERLRDSQDASNLPGEQSLNPEGLWRRAQEDWSHGAGQNYFDRPQSDTSRFRSSKGVDIWTQWQMSLLPEVASKRSSANTNLLLAVAGSYLYAIDGANIVYTQDVTPASPSFTTVTGGPGSSPVAICSDGNNVYTAHGASGVYKTARGSATTASFATGTVSGVLAYVKGRLMATEGPNVYNITAAGALPAALFTHANTDFAWVGFAAGPSNIYMAGFSGDKSLVYRTAVKTDGTGLDAPVVAAELPNGEVVRAIFGYLGFIFLGTDLGVRFCTVNTDGSLRVGALIETPAAVRCFEGQGRFVWFGWSNYDSTSSGLGRMSPVVLTDGDVPVYASDLMATAQGAVLSVVTFQKLRVFSISSSGFYAETTAKVASGTIDSGLFTFGIPDKKGAMFLDLRFQALNGTIADFLASDGGSFVKLGSDATAGHVALTVPCNETLAEAFEVRLQLDRAVDTTKGPVVTRSTLRAYPAPTPGEEFVIPILLDEAQEIQGTTRTMDPAAELSFLMSLEASHKLTTLQVGNAKYSVFVEAHTWAPSNPTQDGKFFNGICVIRAKSLAEQS